MKEQFLFDTIQRMRDRVLLLAEKCPVEKRTLVPAGFNNNVQWHLGHIATVTDRIVYGLSGEQQQLPDTYLMFYGNGTKPGDWTDETPPWAAVIERLTQQPKQITSFFAGKINNPVKENFAKAEIVGELMIFNLYHEGTHTGSLNAMLKVLSN
jgi:uncharacterized damage-inducible protein DinB